MFAVFGLGGMQEIVLLLIVGATFVAGLALAAVVCLFLAPFKRARRTEAGTPAR